MRPSAIVAALLIIVAGLLAGCGGTTRPGGPACLAELDRHGIAFKHVAEHDASDSRCVVDTGVRVSRLEVGLNKPVTMSCGLAAKLDQFDREVIQPLAQSDLGRRVIRINHMGAFSCRTQRSSRRAHLSQHATGQAIDISGFGLSDGTNVSVQQDWSNPGPNGVFLRHLACNACRYFSVVLTPDNNADHHNHFHFDIGPGKSCSGA